MLRDEIRRLAEKAFEMCHSSYPNKDHDTRRIESAILAGVKLMLEREPSSQMKTAGLDTMQHGMLETLMGQRTFADGNDPSVEVYHAMTQELLKELE